MFVCFSCHEVYVFGELIPLGTFCREVYFRPSPGQSEGFTDPTRPSGMWPRTGQSCPSLESLGEKTFLVRSVVVLPYAGILPWEDDVRVELPAALQLRGEEFLPENKTHTVRRDGERDRPGDIASASGSSQA